MDYVIIVLFYDIILYEIKLDLEEKNMNKEVFLKLVGMTEKQVLLEEKKINLNPKEFESFHNGKNFIDKYDELETEESRRKVVLKLIAYGLVRRNGGK